ncbi:3-hydroxyacyl-CoA dehydrogenase-like protein [Lachnellula subtilissima]|uniref:3-hydroxyacyl-CoA dehydrogenase-like protein n=1 Tax=Lachnellula subtilissima TaxID=602034 RepID=A0A8H8U3N8_9HELO|nr:3-hydroxyacyl-CoA dehydrogenase-like protein [Lachnellula subtilissima]
MAYTWTAPDITEQPAAIIGGGVLGRRLAMMWASAGNTVVIYERIPQVAAAAIAYVEENIDAQVNVIKGKRGAVRLASSLEDAVKDAWMVIEAVPERLEIKIPLFGELDKITQPNCILATNSSSYRSSEMIELVEKKYRVCNTHYFMPPIMNPVEIMTCGHTDPAIIQHLMEATKAVGFTPVHAKKESTGFIFNRIWAAMKRESLLVIQDGVATPEDIDTLFVSNFSAKVGICELMDKVGLDTVYNIEKHYVEERKLPGTTLDWLKASYLDKGNLGDKSGKGLLAK